MIADQDPEHIGQLKNDTDSIYDLVGEPREDLTNFQTETRSRFDQVDARFDRMDDRFDEVLRRLPEVS